MPLLTSKSGGAINSTLVTPAGELWSPARGVYAVQNFTPAGAAYGAADIMSTAKEFSFYYADGTAVPAGSVIRILAASTKIDITAVPSGQTSYTLHLYSVTPPSAQADNDAWTMVSADLASYRGSVALGTPADLGGCLYIKTDSLSIVVKLTGTSLFGELVTAGAHTATAVAREVVLLAEVL